MQHRRVEDAAEACGLSPRTIYRYLDDPAFLAQLWQSEGIVLDQATRQLLQLQNAAITTFYQVLTSKNAAPSIKLRAAAAVMDYLLRLRELRAIETRIARLEELAYERQP